jgi:hypothetical protein
MNYNQAIKLINKHSEAESPESFMYYILMCQVKGKVPDTDINNFYNEILFAFEIINSKINCGKRKIIKRSLILDVCNILATGWELYSWWVKNNYLPQEFLDIFSNILQDLQFAWCRIIDGTTNNLKEAIERKKPWKI